MSEEHFEGLVSNVHDGDSLHITPAGSKRRVVRLAGIDAPEIKQAFGLQSRETLRSLGSDQYVTAQCHKRDKYQRLVCVVSCDGIDINLRMLKAGMAWHYKQFQSEQGLRKRYANVAAHRKARAANTGLWAEEPLPPWEFRSRAR